MSGSLFTQPTSTPTSAPTWICSTLLPAPAARPTTTRIGSFVWLPLLCWRRNWKWSAVISARQQQQQQQQSRRTQVVMRAHWSRFESTGISATAPFFFSAPCLDWLVSLQTPTLPPTGHFPLSEVIMCCTPLMMCLQIGCQFTMLLLTIQFSQKQKKRASQSVLR